MKNLMILISLLSFVYLFTFSGCGEDEEIYTPPAMTNAVIKGEVKCDLDLTNFELENAPQGTKIISQIDAIDLVANPVPGYPYGVLTFETTVDGNGDYSITVNAGTQNIDVTIYPEDFVYDQIVWVDPIFGDTVGGAKTTQRVVFKEGIHIVNVIKNVIRIEDITY